MDHSSATSTSGFWYFYTLERRNGSIFCYQYQWILIFLYTREEKRIILLLPVSVDSDISLHSRGETDQSSATSISGFWYFSTLERRNGSFFCYQYQWILIFLYTREEKRINLLLPVPVDSDISLHSRGETDQSSATSISGFWYFSTLERRNRSFFCYQYQWILIFLYTREDKYCNPLVAGEFI